MLQITFQYSAEDNNLNFNLIITTYTVSLPQNAYAGKYVREL